MGLKGLMGIFMVLGLSNVSLAADAEQNDVALMAGVATLTNNGGSPSTYGVAYDRKIMGSWSAGLYYNTLTPSAITVLGTSYNPTVTNTDFSFKYSPDNWNVGLLLGSQSYSSGVTGASTTTWFNYGVTAGWDYALGSGFSLGVQGDAIWTTQSNGYFESNYWLVGKFWF